MLKAGEKKKKKPLRVITYSSRWVHLYWRGVVKWFVYVNKDQKKITLSFKG